MLRDRLRAMDDTPKNRKWFKDPDNWKQDESIVQLRDPTTKLFIVWFEIRSSTATKKDNSSREVGDGLFYIGDTPAKPWQIIGYFSGRQIGPTSAWDRRNDFYNTHNDKVP